MPGAWEAKPVSILVAILTREVVHMSWTMGLKSLILPGGVISTLTGMPFDHARNMACQQAIEGKFTHLFFLDDDTIPPHDAVVRLLQHNVPIVSGVYYRRSPPIGIPVMLRDVFDSNGKLRGRQHVEQYKIPDLIEVDYVGSGCLLIKREVLEQCPPQTRECPKCKVEYPSEHRWFDWAVDRHDLPPDRRLSEDYTWNAHVRRHGYKILVDTSIQCRHVGWAEARLERQGKNIGPVFIPADVRCQA